MIEEQFSIHVVLRDGNVVLIGDKTQVENAVNADGEFGYKRALYNQDDVYKDVVKDVLEIDDLQKDADEMEL